MATFYDTAGRDWIVELTQPIIAEVKQSLGVDLSRIDDFKKLGGNIDLICRVLFAVCNRQIVAREMSAVDFVQCLAAGQVFPRAFTALLNARAALMPSRTRKAVRALRKFKRKS